MVENVDNCNTLLICGNIIAVTEKFNEQTTFEQVFDHTQQVFEDYLPESYRIVYYDSKNMSLTDLKKQLRNGTNPFKINSASGVRSSTSMSECLRLYIVDTVHSRIESTDDQISSTTCSTFDDDQDDNSCSANNDIVQMNNQLPLFIPQSIDLEKQKVFFTLDVKPHQRNIYMSDQFNVRSTKPNGRIAHIQGRKDENEKMLQKLPKLHIPLIAIQPNVTLLVAVVSEKLEDGMRIWYKHPNKKFLPEKYGRDTKPVNPIILLLNRRNVNNEEEFTLHLQMVTKWERTRIDPEEVYRYDDQKTRNLHPAETDSISPRLICVLQQDGHPIWDTFCLSDFIRSPKGLTQRSASVVLENTDGSKQKRRRHNN